jgi:hypothetical protein
MKSNRFTLVVALLALSAMGFAQSDAQIPAAQSEAQKPNVAAMPTHAQQSFDVLKTLAGSWNGPVTTFPPQADMDGTPTQVTLRVTSRGNALVHEMKEAGKPDDPTRYDHPITMLYLDGDRLLLTHYCDAGNRPRMAARVSPDGKTVEFDFVDVDGGTEYGHMNHALFTVIDANHHIEDWTYLEPGDKAVRAHLDLQRTK